MHYKVAAFYKFVHLDDFRKMRSSLLEACQRLELVGTILLAKEGINGTIAGSPESITKIFVHFKEDSRMQNLQVKYSGAKEKPFHRIRVSLKKEIISMGVAGVDPSKRTGQHVSAEEWNQLITDPEVVVLDTRNTYETAIGTFENAVDPQTESFSNIVEYVDKNLAHDKGRRIAMFCTGGIRCEKLSSHMLEEGFKEIYQLSGGILKYLEVTPEEKSRWKGDCFVFDHRVSIGHELQEGNHTMCHGCGYPLTAEDRHATGYEKGVSCPKCVDSLTKEKRDGLRERQKQIQLAKKRHTDHLGQKICKA